MTRRFPALQPARRLHPSRLSTSTPAHFYHYRVAAFHQNPGGAAVLGPEGTFSTSSDAVPISGRAPNVHRFKLRKRLVRIGKLRRRSRKLIIRLHGLPAKTRVKLKLTAGGAKQSARKKANTRGRLTFKLVLSKRVRKAIRRKSLKKVKIKLTATPPGGGRSSVTLKKRIGR